jgi:putative oxidoreductase
MKHLDACFPTVLSIVRIVAALVFLEHGLMKVFHVPIAPPGMASPLPPLLYVSGLIELAGGALLALGFCTRTTAFICSGEMAFAYFIGHFPKNFFPAQNGGDAAILFCFIFLLLVFSGPGSLSVDSRLGDRAP